MSLPPRQPTFEDPADNGLSSAHEAWAEIASIAEIIEPKARSREEFIQECKSGAFDNVVAAYRTFMSVAITGMVDEELVSHLPKSLKFMAHNGMERPGFMPLWIYNMLGGVGGRQWLIL